MKNKGLILSILATISLAACSSSFNASTGGSSTFDVSREEFYFALSWGVNLEKDASYDSRTNVLIKTKNVINRSPDEYVTTYEYPKMDELYEKAKSINLYSYPDLYNPYASSSIMSNPSQSYLLKINNKTILSENCVYSRAIPDGLSKKDKLYLDFIYGIIDTLCNSEEWKALPEYEVFYE